MRIGDYLTKEEIAITAGGPGSGRHKEYGTFKQDGSPRGGGGKKTTYYNGKSGKGTLVMVDHYSSGPRKSSTVYEGGSRENLGGTMVQHGDLEKVGKFLKDRYGINHDFSQRANNGPRAKKSSRPYIHYD